MRYLLGLSVLVLAACSDQPTVPPSSTNAELAHAITFGSPVELGALPGPPFGIASAINNRGQAVGASAGLTEPWGQAVVWDAPGLATKLDPLPGYDGGQAWDINDRGQIVGVSYASYSGESRATLWERTGSGVTVVDLGGQNSAAVHINNGGLIVGGAVFPDGYHAALWSVTPQGITIRDLGTLPGDVSSWTAAINDRGQVVGASASADGVGRAVMWVVGSAGVSITDLGTPMEETIVAGANDVNAMGQIVGYVVTPDYVFHPVMWEVTPLGVSVRDLGDPEGWSSWTPMRINNRGEVVGFGAFGPNGETHGILWTEAQGAQDLPYPSCSIDLNHCGQAEGINDRGQIVGEIAVGPDLVPVIWNRGP